jgi:hypothetical protein
MSSSTVLLDTETVTTDSQAQLVSAGTIYTNARFTFTNNSSTAAVYRLVSGLSTYTDLTPRSPEVTVDGGATTTITAVRLSHSSSPNYDIFLERKEFGSWVRQGDSIPVTTKVIDDVNASTSSEAAVLSWDKTHTVNYSVRLHENGSFVRSINDVPLNTATNKYEVVLNGLSNTKTYMASIQTVELNMNSTAYYNQWQELKQVTFTPSDYANLNIDAVYCSYADLSWDDGNVGDDEEDEEAEFKIVRKLVGLTGSIESTDTAMDWTPDTTKTLSMTGLLPGRRYLLSLYRRGVNGVEVFQDGSGKDITAKTSEITTDGPASTRIKFNWTPVYPGASYRYQITGGGIGITSGLTAMMTRLTPDTSYTFSLMVVEKGQSIPVTSFDAATDKSGYLTLIQARHTNMSLEAHTFSSSDSRYIVANAESPSAATKSSSEFTLSGDVTHTAELRGLAYNSPYKMYLFRVEYGTWIKQTFPNGLGDHLAVNTKNLAPETSVASTSALVKWEEGYTGADYQLLIFDTDPEQNEEGPAVQTKANTQISTAGSARSSVITGLSMETRYWAGVLVTETTASGVAQKYPLRLFTFETSAGAVFQIGRVRASDVRFTWDAGEVKEEDGVADFKVRKQVVGESLWIDVTSWLPHDTTSFATITGLSPGTEYSFALARKTLDGGSATQAIVDVETKSSSLTISGTASSHIQVTWSSLYDNAQYQLVYTAKDGDPVTFGGGPITATEALLTGLESSTEYTIELYAIEEGVAVGISTVALGSAAVAKTDQNLVLIAGVAVTATVAVVGVVVLLKMKAAKAAVSVVA